MRSLFAALRRAAETCKIWEFTKPSVAAALGVALFAQVAMADDPKTWAGIGWGLGIAADFDLGARRVADAQIINGNIVRVTDTSSNVGVGFVLEAHYFFKDIAGLSNILGMRAPKKCDKDPNCTEFANGPFVAVEIGGGSSATANAGPITGYALGWMLGLHHPSVSVSNTSSWNLGVGLRVDPQAKVLGDGFVANQPPPAGETAVRFKKEPRYGLMLLSSFSF